MTTPADRSGSVPLAKTVFQRIIDREIPAKIAYEDTQSLAFYDVNPQAPIHVLIIPKKPIPSLDHVHDDDLPLLAHLWRVVRDLARALGCDEGYRVVVNCGSHGGQTVPHLHFHLLAGRGLTWPPG